MRTFHIVLFAAIGLILAAQAAGAPPTVVVEQVDRTRTIPAGAFCDFPFVVHSEGTRRTTTYTDNAGNFDRFTIHLSSWKTSYTANGKTIGTVLAGPVIVESQPDGTALVRIPGNDGLLVAKGQGPIYSDNGLIVWVAPSVADWQNAIEILHASGGYRSAEDFAAALCGAIG